MARVETVVVPKPEFDALVAEVERLRAAGNRLLAYIEHADLQGQSFDSILTDFKVALKGAGSDGQAD